MVGDFSKAKFIERAFIKKHEKIMSSLYFLWANKRFVGEPLKKIIKLQNEANRLFWIGGVRSLKTSSLMTLIGWHITGVYPFEYDGYKYSRPINVMVAGRKFDLLKDVLQEYLIGCQNPCRTSDLKWIVDEINRIQVKGLKKEFWTPHFNEKGEYDGDSRIILKSYEEGWENFQSYNEIDCIMLDEEPPLEIYTECCARLTEFTRGTEKMEKRMLFCSMYPGKGYTPLVRQICEGKEKEVVTGSTVYIQSGWAENPFLTEKNKAELRTQFPPREARAREFGEIIMGEGAVFQMDPREIVIDAIPQRILGCLRYIGGLDPAVKISGTWGGIVLGIDGDGVVYVMQEYLRKNMTQVDHHQALDAFYPQGITVICDPGGNAEDQTTGLSTFEQLRRTAHFSPRKAYKSNNAKELAINTVYQLYNQKKLKILKNCTQFMNQFAQYARDDKGEIIKHNDHILDAFFYALNQREHALSLAEAETGNGFYNCLFTNAMAESEHYNHLFGKSIENNYGVTKNVYN